MTLSLCPAPALRQNKQRWRCRYLSCQLYLQPLKELPETPVLELHPASPASVPAEMEDVPAVSSVPVLAVSTGDIPGVVSSPELEPLEPSGPGLRAPAGMAPGLIEPEADPEPTSPCAASTPCAVREEPPTILQFTPRLVAEQLTLMCAVSRAGSRGRGWAFPVSRAARDLPSPDVDSCDLGPRPSFRTTHPVP